MAYTATFDPARKLIIVVQTGSDNTQHAALESMREVRLDPRFRSDYGIVCDFRQGELQPSVPDSIGAATVCKTFFKGQKVAYVIPPALAPMAELRAVAAAPEVEIRSFFEIADAEAWLCGASS